MGIFETDITPVLHTTFLDDLMKQDRHHSCTMNPIAAIDPDRLGETF
jgi:hypothetical protein